MNDIYIWADTFTWWLVIAVAMSVLFQISIRRRAAIICGIACAGHFALFWIAKKFSGVEFGLLVFFMGMMACFWVIEKLQTELIYTKYNARLQLVTGVICLITIAGGFIYLMGDEYIIYYLVPQWLASIALIVALYGDFDNARIDKRDSLFDRFSSGNIWPTGLVNRSFMRRT